jgi:hypothetical protein
MTNAENQMAFCQKKSKSMAEKLREASKFY